MADNTLKAIPINSLTQASAIETDDQIIAYRESDDNAYRASAALLLGAASENIADAFNAATAYEVGDYCIYGGILYKCIAAHSGAWSESDFEVVTISAELTPLYGSHNCIYYEKYLGDHVTDEQWAEIKAGTFRGMYIGSYWNINGTKWIIAAFNYYLNTGNTYKVDDNHVLIIPEGSLYTAVMNSNGETTGAYAGSEMYSTGLNEAKTMANNAFGSAHILTHENYFTNAINATYTYPNAGAWYDCTLEIMNEEMVYGTTIAQQQVNSAYRPTTMAVAKSQLPLFQFRHDLISIRASWWLRDIFSDANFCRVGSAGHAGSTAASTADGVRPAFCIY